MEQHNKSFRYDLADYAKKTIRFVSDGRKRFNRKVAGVYSPKRTALIGVLAIAMICIILLFIPDYTGLADDGSLSDIMSAAGLGYRAQDLQQPAGAYFVRVYLHSAEIRLRWFW